MMDPNGAGGWALGFTQGADGVPVPVVSDNATGLTNRMQSSDCDEPGTPQSNTGGCFFDPAAWDRIHARELAAMQPNPDPRKLTPSVSFEEAEFTLNRKNLSAFIADGKLMASKLLPGVCWPGSFFVMRTGGPTNDHIGPQTGKGDDRFLWVEYAQFRPNIPLDATKGLKPRLQKKASALQEYWEQLMTCKYNARPHWGKAWPRVFTSAACPIKDLFPAANWATQLSLQQQYDPAKLFETAMLSAVLAGGEEKPPGPPSAFCTNELGCYCSADIECGAPAGSPTGPLCCQTAPDGLAPYRVCLPCAAG